MDLTTLPPWLMTVGGVLLAILAHRHPVLAGLISSVFGKPSGTPPPPEPPPTSGRPLLDAIRRVLPGLLDLFVRSRSPQSALTDEERQTLSVIWHASPDEDPAGKTPTPAQTPR